MLSVHEVDTDSPQVAPFLTAESAWEIGTSQRSTNDEKASLQAGLDD